MPDHIHMEKARTKAVTGYEAGKQGEQDSWEVLCELGYIRPTPKQRDNIVSAFAHHGKIVNPRAFDLIKKGEEGLLNNRSELIKSIPTKGCPTLFELKTAGKDRRKNIGEDFTGLGFTLTQKEKENAETLKSNYKFLFLNLKTKKHKICNLQDFFNEAVSRIYPTWSIWVTAAI